MNFENTPLTPRQRFETALGIYASAAKGSDEAAAYRAILPDREPVAAAADRNVDQAGDLEHLAFERLVAAMPDVPDAAAVAALVEHAQLQGEREFGGGAELGILRALALALAARLFSPEA